MSDTGWLFSHGKLYHAPMFRFAEFFAGIGLVRLGLGDDYECVFANDINEHKKAVYSSNFGSDEFHLGDIGSIRGMDLPDIDLATASFPCTDISLAGKRGGLDGKESRSFWQFARVIEEMGERKPKALLIENVSGLQSSNGGKDLTGLIGRLNGLGYWCDVLVIDALRFVPQSRTRMFIVAVDHDLPHSMLSKTDARPDWVVKLARVEADLRFNLPALPKLPRPSTNLVDIVERTSPDDSRWWDEQRTAAFLSSMSLSQRTRLQNLMDSNTLTWRTAYRRTRNGIPVWEARRDEASGCLRTARGGSSKQAVLEAGNGELRVRWMFPVEYARLQGAPDLKLDAVTKNQALSALGDAVCVPVISWIAGNYLTPVLSNTVDDLLMANVHQSQLVLA